jgi:hypothetical protein
MKVRHIFAILLTFTVPFGFGQSHNDSKLNTGSIEIFLLKEKVGNFDSTRQCSYCFIPMIYDMADTAFIKNDEIIGYEISNGKHFILINKSCQIKLKQLDKQGKTFPFRSAFALVVNGKPIYGGWFLNRFVSNFHACDWVHIFSPLNENGNDKMELNLKYPRHKTTTQFEMDPRNNKYLFDVLKESGRWH